MCTKERINWNTSRASDLSVDCPSCGSVCRVINASIPRLGHILKLEVICRNCDKYRYVRMEILNVQTFNSVRRRSTYDSRRHFRVERVEHSD